MKKLVWGLLIIAIGAGATWWYKLNGQETPKQALTVQTTEIAMGNVRQVVSTSGSVRALITVSVGSQLSGQITELYADFNSEVKKDQVIARLDDSTYRTRVNQAKANLGVAEASIKLQQANIESAKITAANTEREYQRNKSLQAKGSVSESALDSSRATFLVAQANVEIARAQLENAQANLKQVKAALESAEIDLARTYIRSPINGTVVKRSVDVGQTVAASLSAPELFTIAQDLRQVQIDAQVDEADIGRVSNNAPVSFTVDAYPEQHFKGTIEQIRLAATELDNVVTYTVVISAENPQKILLPGMTANVEIVTGERRNVMVLPNEALRFRPSNAFKASLANNSNSNYSERQLRLITLLKNELNLPAETLQKALAVIDQHREVRADGTNNMAPPDPFGSNAAPSLNAGPTMQALREILNDEQYTRLQTLQEGMKNRRFSDIWIQKPDGIRAYYVEQGVSDDQKTEILSAEVKAGDKVITKVNTTGRR
ncbi:RND family efflux transporter, MFP subunit [Beggiatoa alba B18LD]|uniref:RND family efflux transporter, MFP subunit n=1 Tax=Beggiatoa alba B18LD TaxID=395493 RepID=I3CJ20_9GAMM|nr:efflux RND transporter periplasmic adaptor subunit [Beggiatoa alba]EIJ43613.1 RND family efflux transporter, MFP subunit [Beggiatoa alba B18LD]